MSFWNHSTSTIGSMTPPSPGPLMRSSTLNSLHINDTASTLSPNSSSNATSDESISLIGYIFDGILTNIVVILGLIGNMLTIIILTRRAMRSSTNHYLTALAIWDSLVLFGTVLLISLPPIFPYYKNWLFAYSVSYFYPVALIAQTATIWLMVSFTVERYIAVCHPLRAASMCTITRAKFVIFGVSLGSTLYNIPRWFDYCPVPIVSNVTNRTLFMVPGITEFHHNKIYLKVYLSWLYVPIMCIVPLVVLSVLNFCLILAVRRSQQQRKDMNVRQSRENNVTIMLVSVVIVFIICQVPALVYNLAYAIDQQHIQGSFGYKILSNLRNFLVNVNSAINFILYCALGQKFRRIFVQTFCRRCVNMDNYTPMSGVHTAGTHLHHMPSTKRMYYTSKMPNSRGTPGPGVHSRTPGGADSTHTTSSSSNATTTCLSRTSAESSISNINNANKQPKLCDRSKYGYVSAKKDARKRGTTTLHDSDSEPNYDVVLEHLLPESDKDVFCIYKLDVGKMTTAIKV